MKNLDDLEDFLELQDPGIREQIRKSSHDFRRGQVREAASFLRELQICARKPKK